MTLQAIILAGGLGTRIRPVIGDTPKAMADVGGRPFLELVLDRLKLQGIGRVILAVGHAHEIITAHFGQNYRNVRLTYSLEAEPLGTGGAVKKALALAEDAPCFVLNGDTLTDLSFKDMLLNHVTAKALLSIAVVPQLDVGCFGAVTIDDGRIVRFLEKEGRGPGIINSGTYLMSPNIFEVVGAPDRFSLEHDFFAPNLPLLQPVAYEACGGVLDVGTPDNYERAKALILGNKS